MTSSSDVSIADAGGFMEINVPGTPVPQGSMRAFLHKSTQRVIVTSDNQQLHGWRTGVALVARTQWGARPPLLSGVHLELLFVLPRPGGHYQPRKLLSLPLVFRKNAPERMVKRPDLDKLVRAMGDALKVCGIYKDDGQIDEFVARKRYVGEDEDPFVQVRIYW